MYSIYLTHIEMYICVFSCIHSAPLPEHPLATPIM